MIPINPAIAVSIVIVNYNTLTEIIRCINSVLVQEGISFDVVVIDNASCDHSVATLKQLFGHQIKLIASPINLGFGKANNLGAQSAHGQYVYFINPDAELKGSLALKTLVDYALKHPQAGLIGTTVIETASRKIIASAYHYPGQRHLKTTLGLAHLPGNIAWIQGSSMLMSKARFDQVHGFDPDFFLYAEETDLCLRVRKAGYEIRVCSDVFVEHIGGASQGANRIASTRLKKQQSLYLFYQKHYSLHDCQRLAKRTIKHSRLKLLYLKLFNSHAKTAIIRQQVILHAARQYVTTLT